MNRFKNGTRYNLANVDLKVLKDVQNIHKRTVHAMISQTGILAC